jgi:hypothetical protein
MLQSDCFGTGTDLDGKERAITALSGLLRRWKPRGPRKKNRTWIKALRLRNIGPQRQPYLKFRTGSASKARLCMRFLVRLLRRHRQTLDNSGLHGTQLLLAGLYCRRVYAALRAAEQAMPSTAECNELVENMVNAMRRMKLAGIHQYPKNHMAVHLAKQALVQCPMRLGSNAPFVFHVCTCACGGAFVCSLARPAPDLRLPSTGR